MANLLILPIIATAFAILAIWRTLGRYRQGSFSLAEALGWGLLWIGVAVVFWRPEAATSLAAAVGVGRGSDLVLYVAVIFLLWALFRVTVRLDRLERHLTTVVRRHALDDHDSSHDA